tara:strand:- start:528 stop:1307 length:780 start_codon:yes stop_codon:yes gene_type:complete
MKNNKKLYSRKKKSIKSNKKKSNKRNKYKIVVVNKTNKKNINKMLNKNDWLILHHSHSCPHCIDMLPIWNKFKVSKPNINILEVEGSYVDYVKLPENIYFVPVIHFYNKRKKIFESFDKDITPKSLSHFIKDMRKKTKKNILQKAAGSSEYQIIDKNIQLDYKTLLNNGPWIILFHSKHCGHCINMMGEWSKFKNTKPNINILDIESSNLNKTELPDNIKIIGFPTILFYHNNDITEFNGKRTVDNFNEFVTTKLSTPS